MRQMRKERTTPLILPLSLFLILLFFVPGQQDALGANVRKWDFSKIPVGTLPEEFQKEFFGPYLKYEEVRGTWQVKEFEGKHFLCGENLDTKDMEVGGAARSFLIVKDLECLDGDFSVRFKVVSGKNNPEVGIVFRYLDPQNYYEARYNYMEKNYEIFRVIDGMATDVIGPIDISAEGINEWHSMRATIQGCKIQASFDGTFKGEAVDNAIPRKGRCGLLVRGKTSVYYDDFAITGKGGDERTLARKLPAGTEAWEIATVDGGKGTGRYCSLAFNEYWEPGIAYYDFTQKNPKYASRTSRGWNVETIDPRVDTGYYMALSYNRINEPNVVYFPDFLGPSRDRPYAGLHFAYKRRGAWNVVYAFVRGSVYSSSLALDRDGYPHIAYMDKRDRAFKHCYWNGSYWTIEQFATVKVINMDMPMEVCIAINSKNLPVIAYHDPGKRSLQYAYKQNDGTWAVETVDREEAPLAAGLYLSLALDKGDVPHLGYYVRNQKSLKYAHKKDKKTWETAIVDKDGDVGQYNSIDIDRDGNPHIAYVDCTGGIIRYASQQKEKWSIRKTNCQGYYPSLKLDIRGLPYIAFYDRITDCLRIAHPR